MATSDNPEDIKLLFGMGTMMSDLKRLEAQATSQGFLIAATLIGAAAEAVSEEIETAALNAASIARSEPAGQTYASDRPGLPHRQRTV